MKGEYNVMKSKKDAKNFLRIVKQIDIVKINSILKDKNISQPAISKFISSDSYDDFISLDNVLILCDEIYNACGFVTDMYRDIIQDEKIA